MTPNACRLFTVAEANALLPRLWPLLLALSETAATLRDLDLQAREVAADLAARPANAAVKREWREFQAALAREVARYREQLARVRRLGVEVRDALVGRVDFPALRGDELVYLCYRLGEAAVGHWHPLTGGARGRQPLGRELDIIRA